MASKIGRLFARRYSSRAPGAAPGDHGERASKHMNISSNVLLHDSEVILFPDLYNYLFEKTLFLQNFHFFLFILEKQAKIFLPIMKLF